jgi:hypothetical protein
MFHKWCCFDGNDTTILTVARGARWSCRLWKLSNVGQSLDGWPKVYYLELLRASGGTLSHWTRLHLQSLAPTNPHWARVVDYGPFSLCVIHKDGLWPSIGNINRLMMMINSRYLTCMTRLMMTFWLSAKATILQKSIFSPTLNAFITLTQIDFKRISISLKHLLILSKHLNFSKYIIIFII